MSNNNNAHPQINGKKGKIGFGTFKGVYLPSILTIFGVIMYLRIGWVVGNVGLWMTLIIVILEKEALGGSLMGSLITGVPLAIMLANSGGAWDNAKKFIEEGNLGSKGSDAHKAAIVGDTVSYPYKDTAGPSLNILLKLMAVASLVFAPLILKLHVLLMNLF